MERLKSRKFWVAISSALIVAVGKQFGLELDPEQILSLAGIASLYIVGQAQVDKEQAKAELKSQINNLNVYVAALAKKLEKVTVPAKEAPNSDEIFQG